MTDKDDITEAEQPKHSLFEVLHKLPERIVTKADAVFSKDGDNDEKTAPEQGEQKQVTSPLETSTVEQPRPTTVPRPEGAPRTGDDEVVAPRAAVTPAVAAPAPLPTPTAAPTRPTPPQRPRPAAPSTPMVSSSEQWTKLSKLQQLRYSRAMARMAELTVQAGRLGQTTQETVSKDAIERQIAAFKQPMTDWFKAGSGSATGDDKTMTTCVSRSRIHLPTDTDEELKNEQRLCQALVKQPAAGTLPV